MTRENKLALIIGFSLILVVAILITDHFSPATLNQASDLQTVGDRQTPAAAIDVNHRELVNPDGLNGGVNDIPESNGQYVNPLPINGFASQSDSPIDDDQPETGDKTVTIAPPDPNPTIGAEPVQADSGPKPAPAEFVHHVIKGDTLYSLAVRYYGDGKLWEQLARFNQDRLPDNLQVREGVALRIPAREVLLAGKQMPDTTPGGAKPVNGKTDAKADGKSTPSTQRLVDYKIKADDSLWSIAKSRLGNGARWKEIYDLNRKIIRNPDVLPVGKTIKIPARK